MNTTLEVHPSPVTDSIDPIVQRQTTGETTPLPERPAEGERSTRTELGPGDWQPLSRWLFRFAVVYWTAYCFPEPLIPGLGWAWNRVVGWVAASLFCVKVERLAMTGSGDTTFDYVQTLCFLGLALAGMLVWSLVDRRRQRYDRVADLYRSFLRFNLAWWMLMYGVVKLPFVEGQFSEPSIDRLSQTYGASSPMGLLWTFMGASSTYTMFAGLAECLGGMLLLFRRTAMLGALVSACVMIHVVMLNFCYDVPVKLFSTHLLLMAVCILVPDRIRLANVFFLNRSVPPRPPRLPYQVRWLNPLHICAKWASVSLLLMAAVSSTVLTSISRHDAKSPEWYGTYAVEGFECDGKTIPLVVRDPACWQRVSIQRFSQLRGDTNSVGFRSEDHLTIHTTTGLATNWVCELREDAHLLVGSSPSKTDQQVGFRYRVEEGRLVELEGDLGSKSIKARLKRLERSDFPLVSRGFHWINEYPYNR